AAGAVAAIQSASMQKSGRYLAPEEMRQLLVSTGKPTTDTKVDITKPLIDVGVAMTGFAPQIPVYVEDGAMLNGEVIFDWDYETYQWDPDSYIMMEDPDFINGYFLPQISAGQSYDSPCVDAGNPATIDYVGDPNYTTATSFVRDVNEVDLGYHYGAAKEFTLDFAYVIDPEPDFAYEIVFEPSDPPPYAKYHQVPISVSLSDSIKGDYHIAGWSGTMDDSSKESENAVLMNNNTVVTVFIDKNEFELTVIVIGPGMVDPNGGSFEADSEIEITAYPEPGYAVKEWIGTDSDFDLSDVKTILMDTDREVTVRFGISRVINVPGNLPYIGIQEAIDLSENGDTIIIEPGTYIGRMFNVVGKNITISSANPHDPEVVGTTIIDMD
ncbi:hypothetical protein LCGC14_2916770, partial [marine sediment metagenome]